jgi:hypothetical protein
MGIRNEDAVKADHYFCEKCRPDLHVELTKYVPPTPTTLCPLTILSNHLGDSLSGLGTDIHPPIPIRTQRLRTASLALILRPFKNPRNGETR